MKPRIFGKSAMLGFISFGASLPLKMTPLYEHLRSDLTRSLMLAICLENNHNLSAKKIPFLKSPDFDHVIIKTKYCGINPGDIAFIEGKLPDCPKSLYDVCGVSGAGEIIQIGKNVPEQYLNRNVVYYRSLSRSDKTIGTWSEYAHLHHTTCLILPDKAELISYSGSLVNAITPYSFLESINYKGKQAILSTAGNSATGLALLGISLSRGYPLISIVRRESDIAKVHAFGGKYIISIENLKFSEELTRLAKDHEAKVIFDAVGGSTLNRIIPCLVEGSTVYSYGFVGDGKAFDFNTLTLRSMDLTLTSFCVYSNRITNNPHNLQKVLNKLQKIIHQPHFKTNIEIIFTFEDFNQAIKHHKETGAKVAIQFF